MVIKEKGCRENNKGGMITIGIYLVCIKTLLEVCRIVWVFLNYECV